MTETLIKVKRTEDRKVRLIFHWLNKFKKKIGFQVKVQSLIMSTMKCLLLRSRQSIENGKTWNGDRILQLTKLEVNRNRTWVTGIDRDDLYLFRYLFKAGG